MVKNVISFIIISFLHKKKLSSSFTAVKVLINSTLSLDSSIQTTFRTLFIFAHVWTLLASNLPLDLLHLRCFTYYVFKLSLSTVKIINFSKYLNKFARFLLFQPDFPIDIIVSHSRVDQIINLSTLQACHRGPFKNLPRAVEIIHTFNIMIAHDDKLCLLPLLPLRNWTLYAAQEQECWGVRGVLLNTIFHD